MPVPNTLIAIKEVFLRKFKCPEGDSSLWKDLSTRQIYTPILVLWSKWYKTTFCIQEKGTQFSVNVAMWSKPCCPATSNFVSFSITPELFPAFRCSSSPSVEPLETLFTYLNLGLDCTRKKKWKWAGFPLSSVVIFILCLFWNHLGEISLQFWSSINMTWLCH